MYIPINYEGINAIEGSYNPSMVKSYNNAAYTYWCRSLFQRASSVLDFTLPEEWSGKVRDFFYYCLFRFGFVSVFDSVEFGMSFQPCTISGRDFYYQPTNVLISNPAMIQSLDLRIGIDCELLKLTPDYMGIFDIISYYAEKLATLDNAINTSLINTKFAWMLGARNKSAATALKKAFDKINRGEPAVILDMKLLNDPDDKDIPWQFIERSSIKESYITTDLLRDFQTIINNFDAEVGIKTIPYEKKERMVASEADSRDQDSQSRVTVWLNTLESSIDEVHKLYPDLTLSVKLREDDSDADVQEGGNDDGSYIDTDWPE